MTINFLLKFKLLIFGLILAQTRQWGKPEQMDDYLIFPQKIQNDAFLIVSIT